MNDGWVYVYEIDGKQVWLSEPTVEWLRGSEVFDVDAYVFRSRFRLPTNLEEGSDLECGCHFREPYGWVIMAGCSLHDT